MKKILVTSLALLSLISVALADDYPIIINMSGYTLGNTSYCTNQVLTFTDGDSTSNHVTFLSELRIDVGPLNRASWIRIYDWSGARPDPLYGAFGLTNAYTNGLNTTRVVTTSYRTNLTNAYITTTGTTNWFTNNAIYTLYTTNTTWTNVLSPRVDYTFPINTVVQSLTLEDLTFGQGILVTMQTNFTFQGRGRKVLGPDMGY